MNVPGVLLLDSYAGRNEWPVVIVGETPRRFRVKPDGVNPVRLAGPNRWLQPGDTALVPKHSVRVVERKTVADD